jgi:hypothetical protein
MSKRGFATMTPEERSRISRLGGVAAHAKGRAHEWTREEAQSAGSKGGRAVQEKKRALAEDGKADA